MTSSRRAARGRDHPHVIRREHVGRRRQKGQRGAAAGPSDRRAGERDLVDRRVLDPRDAARGGRTANVDRAGDGVGADARALRENRDAHAVARPREAADRVGGGTPAPGGPADRGHDEQLRRRILFDFVYFGEQVGWSRVGDDAEARAVGRKRRAADAAPEARDDRRPARTDREHGELIDVLDGVPPVQRCRGGGEPERGEVFREPQLTHPGAVGAREPPAVLVRSLRLRLRLRDEDRHAVRRDGDRRRRATRTPVVHAVRMPDGGDGAGWAKEHGGGAERRAMNERMHPGESTPDADFPTCFGGTAAKIAGWDPA